MFECSEASCSIHLATGESLILQNCAQEARQKFEASLDDNLNMAEALGAIFDMVRDGNTAMDRGEFRDADRGAFLDRHEFWRSVAEQGAMVRHAGAMPYTNQYVGTPNFLYEGKELVLWCLGPLLGLAALWATGDLRGALEDANAALRASLDLPSALFLRSLAFSNITNNRLQEN